MTLRRYTPLRSKPGHRDPVTPTLRIEVLERDQRETGGIGCVPAFLGAPGECRGRLELLHIKDQPGTGRAPSDRRHTVSGCGWHHGTNRYGGGWATSKDGLAELRAYLLRVEGDRPAAVRALAVLIVLLALAGWNGWTP